jgi:pSer/pThr/pTyr-binding forkhead associated (FHA) protein
MPEQRVNILVYRPDGTLIAQYLLGDGEHLIGRDINCPVYLDSEYISSNHAKLHLSHDGIQIEDLNSTSGTYLDGVTVRGKLRIKPGQVLKVGDLTVQLQPESEGQIGPGSRLGDGRYTLIRMLGRGGMGEVWLAKDEQLDEEVALKKLPPEVGADAMALADMRREVQKSRALSHPNIIRIHDLIQKSGEDPLISLEYVDGTDLTAIAATKTNGVFDWTEIKDWILQLANALEYAHEEKIVHRDLKPGNIMISRSGRLKLADFGIAASVADSLSRSSM